MPNSQLADFVQASNSGYETGKQQASSNALGLFIRTMLATQQKSRELVQEYGLKKENIQTEYDIKSKSPQGIAELAKTQAEGGLKSQELAVKQEAKKAYDAGDRSPEVLKALDIYATPNIFNFIPSGSSLPSTNPLPANPPKYDPKTQKLQYNAKTGQYRVVPK
jgi:hypothetical protein